MCVFESPYPFMLGTFNKMQDTSKGKSRRGNIREYLFLMLEQSAPYQVYYNPTATPYVYMI